MVSFSFFVGRDTRGPKVYIGLWVKPRGRESIHLFFIAEQQEQAQVPAHRASLLLSLEFRIKPVFDLPEPPPSVYSRTISTGNLNLLTGQKIKCERRHLACFCEIRLALLKRGGIGGFPGQKIAAPPPKKLPRHLCSLPVPRQNTWRVHCETSAVGLANSVQSMN